MDGFVDRYKWARTKYLQKQFYQHQKGNVLVYGFIDEVLPGGLMTDINVLLNTIFQSTYRIGNISYILTVRMKNGIPAPYFIYDARITVIIMKNLTCIIQIKIFHD